MDDTPTPPQAFSLELRFALSLRSHGPQPTWQADLTGPAPTAPMHFDSLPDLIRYLARLELQPVPPSGIR